MQHRRTRLVGVAGLSQEDKAGSSIASMASKTFSRSTYPFALAIVASSSYVECGCSRSLLAVEESISEVCASEPLEHTYGLGDHLSLKPCDLFFWFGASLLGYLTCCDLRFLGTNPSLGALRII